MAAAIIFWLRQKRGEALREAIEISANCPERYCDARLEVDFGRRAVVLDQRPVRLTRVELWLLTMLAQNAGEIVLRAALLGQVWGYRPEIRTRTLDVHIRRLRSNLKDYGPKHIETVFGIGHRLAATPSHLSGAA